MGNQYVHQDNREGHALRQRTEHPDQHCQNAAADRIYNPAIPVDGGCCIVRRHKDCTEQQAAGKQFENYVTAGDQGDHRYSSKIAQRDYWADNLTGHQINASQDQCNGTGFPQTAGTRAKQHVQMAGKLIRCPLLEQAKRGCCGNRVGVPAAVPEGHHPIAHLRREGRHQHDARRQSWIDKVLPNAAEHLLYNNNCHYASKDRNQGVDRRW